MFGGGLNLIKQTGNGEIQFINCNNELKNYPTTYGTKYVTSQAAPKELFLSNHQRINYVCERLQASRRD